MKEAAAAFAALVDIYRRKDGTMRICRHYYYPICAERRCYGGGCQLAADIIKEFEKAGRTG